MNTPHGLLVCPMPAVATWDASIPAYQGLDTLVFPVCEYHLVMFKGT